MITSLLYLVLYAIAAAILLEIVFWAVGLLVAVPPRIRQLIYAFVGVIILIDAFQIIMGGTGFVGIPIRH